ncbi:maleylpyruvate isomerase family mycothiol-dependent enzyme [Kitasatospora atroaurantiaca]|uniref:Maleylpyruvate isomerase n=1 Tax=Kitasatospora atroaurantiaca TaxID=285545 RepID=A0A561EWQ3_9ACTN|nr:maleylpyruvate isomerase family mycothiol-dependent enzyme [Kitasatospora atroaurantiaca]TWE20040.1 maleylpyruvate isomerase [Kitasatospora atroaurantiaca]
MTDAEAAAATLRTVAESTEHLLRSVAELEAEELSRPSALPGWTRGHVLAHLARNADSLVNLLDSARTGRDIPQYASSEAREQGIQDGAGRPLAEQLEDLRASHARFTEAAAKLPDEAWSAQLRHRTGYLFPAYELPWKRLMELEYHHVDLDAGYTPAHWPEAFAADELVRLAEQFASVDGLPPVLLTADDRDLRVHLGPAGAEPELTVEGPVRALTGWLSGRSDGDGLQVHKGGEQLADPRTALPKLPPLG